jgi:L-threonylcarbamoyladenylate synthase
VIDEHDVSQAKAVLDNGGVVAMPTDTVYGLAVNPRVAGAVEELFRTKGRPEAAALPVLVSSFDDAGRYGIFSPQGNALAAAFWPGPLTIVVPRSPEQAGLRLGGDESTIGLRCPGLADARALLEAAGPLAVTSANHHAQPPCHTAGEVRTAFGSELFVLDGGTCDGEPSTVVAVVGNELRLLRDGAIPLARLVEVCC